MFKLSFTKDKDREIDSDRMEEKPEKKDLWAMLIAFSMTILPVVILIWAALALIIWLLF